MCSLLIATWILDSDSLLYAPCPMLYAHSLLSDSLYPCPYATEFLLQPLIASV
jgi:hypothetical protein